MMCISQYKHEAKGGEAAQQPPASRPTPGLLTMLTLCPTSAPHLSPPYGNLTPSPVYKLRPTPGAPRRPKLQQHC